MRGRYDDAARELRAGRRAMGDTTDVQFTQPMRYAEAMIALGRGDLPAARDAVAAGLAGAHRRGQRVMPGRCCGSGCGWRPTRRPGTATGASRSRPNRAALRGLAADCGAVWRPRPRPRAGYQALVAAEHARAGGAGVARLVAAVAAWQEADEP